MGELADIAKQRNPYLRLEDGESIVVKYKGFKMVPSSFDPEKELYRFLLEVSIAGEIQVKYWDTGSNRVAIVFDSLKEGDEVKITKNVVPAKNGKGTVVSYEVEPTKKASKVKEKNEKEKDGIPF